MFVSNKYSPGQCVNGSYLVSLSIYTIPLCLFFNLLFSTHFIECYVYLCESAL